MDEKDVSRAMTKADDAGPRTNGWLRWLAWLDEMLPGLGTVPREPGVKDTQPYPRRCFQGTVVSLQGRFPNGSGGFRLERIGMLEEGATTLVSLPVHEAARIPSTLCLGIQVSVTVRDGLVVFVKIAMSKVHARRQRHRRHDVAVG